MPRDISRSEPAQNTSRCLAATPAVTVRYLAVIAGVTVRYLTVTPGVTVRYLAVTPGVAARYLAVTSGGSRAVTVWGDAGQPLALGAEVWVV